MRWFEFHKRPKTPPINLTKKADPDDKSGAYVTATAVTTRTATTHEDLGKNAKTQQLEEKTVATTTTHNLNRQEQRVVTQEVKTTATVTSGEQVFSICLLISNVCQRTKITLISLRNAFSNPFFFHKFLFCF